MVDGSVTNDVWKSFTLGYLFGLTMLDQMTWAHESWAWQLEHETVLQYSIVQETASFFPRLFTLDAEYLRCSRQNIVSVFVDVPWGPQNLTTLWSLLGEALVYGNMGKGTVLRRGLVRHRHSGPRKTARLETSLGRVGLDHRSCKMLPELTQHDTQKTENPTVQIRCFHSFWWSWTLTVCWITSCHSWLRFCWPVCAPTSRVSVGYCLQDLPISLLVFRVLFNSLRLPK